MTPKLREQQRIASNRYYAKNKEKIKEKNRKGDGFYSVYYIPEEHYVGMTNCVKFRLASHKHTSDRDLEGFRVLKTFDCPHKAHIYETQWHSMGANGSHLRYEL